MPDDRPPKPIVILTQQVRELLSEVRELKAYIIKNIPDKSPPPPEPKGWYLF